MVAPNLLKTHLFLLSRLVEQSSLALLCKTRLIYFVLLHFCCIFIVHLVILVYSVYFVQTVQHFGELRYFKCTIETLICLDFFVLEHQQCSMVFFCLQLQAVNLNFLQANISVQSNFTKYCAVKTDQMRLYKLSIC